MITINVKGRNESRVSGEERHEMAAAENNVQKFIKVFTKTGKAASAFTPIIALKSEREVVE